VLISKKWQIEHEGYPENKFRLRILPLLRCGHDGAHGAEFVDSVARHGQNLKTFVQCLHIVLCVFNF